MLAEAARNTPGATELEPIREAQPGLKRKRVNGAESREEQKAPEVFEPQV